MDIGKKIKEIRISKGMTLDALANKLGYKSRSAVYKIENNDVKISVDKLEKIATALDVSADEILNNNVKKTDANRVINGILQYNKESNMLYKIFGVKEDEYYDLAIISPTYNPDDIFSDDDNIILLKKDYSYSTYDVYRENYKILYIKCMNSESNIIDSILLLGVTNVLKILYLSTAYSIDNDLSSKIVVSNECVLFKGINTILCENDKKNINESIVPVKDIDFVNEIVNKSIKNDIRIKQKKIYCLNSRIFYYSNLDEIKKSGFNILEYGSGLFHYYINMINKTGISLLIICDNELNKKSLFERIEEDDNNSIIRKCHIPKVISLIIDENN